MCSTSNVTEALKGMTVTSGSTSTVPSISPQRLQRNRSQYILVDVREAGEIEGKALAVPANAQMTLGAICHDAGELLRLVDDDPSSKTLVMICPTGRRAELAAQNLLRQSPQTRVAVVQRGMVGLEHPAAVRPDFLVVLGLAGPDATEKLSLALAAVATAADAHDTVVLALMSDGVQWFVRPDSPKATTTTVETVVQGEPFQPCKAMLGKFLANGGVILACTSCVLHRGYSFETDMMDCVQPLQMPDLVRMLGEARGGCLQFL